MVEVPRIHQTMLKRKSVNSPKISPKIKTVSLKKHVTQVKKMSQHLPQRRNAVSSRRRSNRLQAMQQRLRWVPSCRVRRVQIRKEDTSRSFSRSLLRSLSVMSKTEGRTQSTTQSATQASSSSSSSTTTNPEKMFHALRSLRSRLPRSLRVYAEWRRLNWKPRKRLVSLLLVPHRSPQALEHLKGPKKRTHWRSVVEQRRRRYPQDRRDSIHERKEINEGAQALSTTSPTSTPTTLDFETLSLQDFPTARAKRVYRRLRRAKLRQRRVSTPAAEMNRRLRPSPQLRANFVDPLNPHTKSQLREDECARRSWRDPEGEAMRQKLRRNERRRPFQGGLQRARNFGEEIAGMVERQRPELEHVYGKDVTVILPHRSPSRRRTARLSKRIMDVLRWADDHTSTPVSHPFSIRPHARSPRTRERRVKRREQRVAREETERRMNFLEWCDEIHRTAPVPMQYRLRVMQGWPWRHPALVVSDDDRRHRADYWSRHRPSRDKMAETYVHAQQSQPVSFDLVHPESLILSAVSPEVLPAQSSLTFSPSKQRREKRQRKLQWTKERRRIREQRIQEDRETRNRQGRQDSTSLSRMNYRDLVIHVVDDNTVNFSLSKKFKRSLRDRRRFLQTVKRASDTQPRFFLVGNGSLARRRKNVRTTRSPRSSTCARKMPEMERFTTQSLGPFPHDAPRMQRRGARQARPVLSVEERVVRRGKTIQKLEVKRAKWSKRRPQDPCHDPFPNPEFAGVYHDEATKIECQRDGYRPLQRGREWMRPWVRWARTQRPVYTAFEHERVRKHAVQHTKDQAHFPDKSPKEVTPPMIQREMLASKVSIMTGWRTSAMKLACEPRLPETKQSLKVRRENILANRIKPRKYDLLSGKVGSVTASSKVIREFRRDRMPKHASMGVRNKEDDRWSTRWKTRVASTIAAWVDLPFCTCPNRRTVSKDGSEAAMSARLIDFRLHRCLSERRTTVDPRWVPRWSRDPSGSGDTILLEWMTPTHRLKGSPRYSRRNVQRIHGGDKRPGRLPMSVVDRLKAVERRIPRAAHAGDQASTVSRSMKLRMVFDPDFVTEIGERPRNEQAMDGVQPSPYVEDTPGMENLELTVSDPKETELMKTLWSSGWLVPAWVQRRSRNSKFGRRKGNKTSKELAMEQESVYGEEERRFNMENLSHRLRRQERGVGERAREKPERDALVSRIKEMAPESNKDLNWIDWDHWESPSLPSFAPDPAEIQEQRTTMRGTSYRKWYTRVQVSPRRKRLYEKFHERMGSWDMSTPLREREEKRFAQNLLTFKEEKKKAKGPQWIMKKQRDRDRVLNYLGFTVEPAPLNTPSNAEIHEEVRIQLEKEVGMSLDELVRAGPHRQPWREIAVEKRLGSGSPSSPSPSESEELR